MHLSSRTRKKKERRCCMRVRDFKEDSLFVQTYLIECGKCTNVWEEGEEEVSRRSEIEASYRRGGACPSRTSSDASLFAFAPSPSEM